MVADEQKALESIVSSSVGGTDLEYVLANDL